MTTATILDPICDMIVDLAEARDQGLTMEMSEREYAFCSHGCLVKFAKSPQTYIPKVDAWIARQEGGEHHATPHAHVTEMPVIDNGMREWDASCRCYSTALGLAHFAGTARPPVVPGRDGQRGVDALLAREPGR